MARQSGSSEEYTRPIRRLLVGALMLVLFAIFILWRIDSPRAERFRAMLADTERPVQILWAGKPFPFDYGAIDTFNGRIRGLRLYRRALAEEEIGRLAS